MRCVIMTFTVRCVSGARIEALTNVKLDDRTETTRNIDDRSSRGTGSSSRGTGGSDKTVMVRAARQLLSAITKVLILADRVVIKQLVTAKQQVPLSLHRVSCSH